MKPKIIETKESKANLRKLDVNDNSQWMDAEQFLDRHYSDWREKRHLWPPRDSGCPCEICNGKGI